MNTYVWILSVLKYTGLFIATGSSIWSATNVISKEIDGKKRLTFAGKVSILLTIIGLLTTISSNVLQDRFNSQKSEEASIKELNRTNKIILAGQPLLSLDFKLKLDSANKDFIPFLLEADSNVRQYQYKHSQGEISGSKGQSIYLENNVFPLFNASLKKSFFANNEPFLFLVSLDNEQTAILSFGYLNDSTKLSDGSLSDGVYYNSDLAGSLHFGDRRRINTPYFLNKKDSLSINWNINPNTLYNCLSKYNSSIPLTANLPPFLKVAILYDIKALPFDSYNFTSSVNFNIWDEEELFTDEEENDKENKLAHIYNNSRIDMTPNQLSDQTASYTLKGVFKKHIVDSEWGENRVCKALLLVYERTELQ